MKNLLKTSAAIAATAVLLTACGGGGGESTNSNASNSATASTTPATTQNPAPVPANLQTTVPALTYGPATQEYAFVTALNDFRAHMGLGLLKQDAALDKSAQNHLAYVLTNWTQYGGTVDMNTIDPATGTPVAHEEIAANPKFTGFMPMDRAKAAGYTGAYAGEELSYPGGKGGLLAFEVLAQTVYHRAGLMYQQISNIGIAVGTDRSQTTVIEIGFQDWSQHNGSDYVGVYPYDGQKDIKLHMMVELPNPFPDLSLQNADYPTKTGYPVSLSTVKGSKLEVINFTVMEAGATEPLSARLLTSLNDPNKLLEPHVAFLVPNAPYKSATTYKVTFSGRVNNVLLNKTWSFTTK